MGVQGYEHFFCFGHSFDHMSRNSQQTIFKVYKVTESL